MAHHYSTRVFAGFWPQLSWRAGGLLGGIVLVLAATLLPRAGSPALAAPASQPPVTAPAAFGLLASLPTATWLPYPALASRSYQLGAGGEAGAAAYQPARYFTAPTANPAGAVRRSWNTIKRMFQ